MLRIPSSYSFILSLKNRGLGFLYIYTYCTKSVRCDKIYLLMILIIYFFINKAWASFAIFNVPQHLVFQGPRTEQPHFVWKPQKIVFSLRSRWRFIFRLLYLPFFTYFQKSFRDKYSVSYSYSYITILQVFTICFFTVCFNILPLFCCFTKKNKINLDGNGKSAYIAS